jgi:hypothetical protein
VRDKIYVECNLPTHEFVFGCAEYCQEDIQKVWELEQAFLFFIPLVRLHVPLLPSSKSLVPNGDKIDDGP